jgi:hypothetical protein
MGAVQGWDKGFNETLQLWSFHERECGAECLLREEREALARPGSSVAFIGEFIACWTSR